MKSNKLFKKNKCLQMYHLEIVLSIQEKTKEFQKQRLEIAPTIQAK